MGEGGPPHFCLPIGEFFERSSRDISKIRRNQWKDTGRNKREKSGSKSNEGLNFLKWLHNVDGII